MNISKALRALVGGMAALMLLPGAARATVLISSSTYGGGVYDISASPLSTFRGLLNTATGNDIAFAADLSNAAQVASADALIVQFRGTSDTLSAAEFANISAFIATGKRVLLGGENYGWNTWNSSILSLVGGTATPDFTGNATTVYTHPLTAGVSTVSLAYGAGAAGGGTSLFDLPFANLWGASENVLSVEDVNLFTDSYIGNQDNQQFVANIADWLAASAPTPPVTVPAPGGAVAFIFGLAGLLYRRRHSAD